MMVSNNYTMRAELQQVERELEDCKKKCEELGQENVRFRNKVEEAQAKEIEQLYGNVANGIETRHVEGNDDEGVHEAINSDLIESGIVDTKQLIMLADTLYDSRSLKRSDDQLAKIVNETVGVTTNTHGEKIEEVETRDTPTHYTTAGSVRHDIEFIKNQTGQNMNFTKRLAIGTGNSNISINEDFDSGTLMRDASKEETVIIEAVKTSIDQFNETGDEQAGSKTCIKSVQETETVKTSLKQSLHTNKITDLCQENLKESFQRPH